MMRVLECKACGQRSFYDKSQCLDCGNDEFLCENPGTGQVISVSTVHVTPEGVREPNRLGLASFPGDANIIAQIGDSVSSGDDVVLKGEYKLRHGKDGIIQGARLLPADE